jgi:hypothetical protein
MAKLKVEGGEIMAQATFNVYRMNVVFTRRAINVTGDLGRIDRQDNCWCGGDHVGNAQQATIEAREERPAPEDWNKLLLEISKLYATIDDEWADADVGDMDEFDPWHALRELSKEAGARVASQGQGQFTQDELHDHAVELVAIGLCGLNQDLWGTRRRAELYMEEHFLPRAARSTQQREVQ